MICDLIRKKEGFCRPTLLAQLTKEELKKSKNNNLDKKRYQIADLALKRSPKTLMIAKVAHADDKYAETTMIIGVYVPTRY